MTRGNQRDIDRARAEKRKGPMTQHEKDGLTVAQRKERDTKAMAEKAAAKAAAKEAAGGK